MTRKKTILLADDDPRLRTLVRLSLGDHFDLVEASDGEQALEEVRQRKPDLVLLDVMMPKVDGLEVCRQLKSDPSTNDTGVVMLTARNSPDTVEQALELGADDYITKPFSPRALLDKVMELLS